MSDIERCPDCGREAVFRYAAIGGIDRCENDAFHDRDYARNASTQGEAFSERIYTEPDEPENPFIDVANRMLALVGEAVATGTEDIRAERDALREELERVKARLRLVRAARQHNVERNEELTAEVERLREALERIASHRDHIKDPDYRVVDMQNLARTALSNDTQEGT